MTKTFANGIDKKYEEMFRTYFTSLCYFANKYVRDFDSCKEIVHKVFVNIWEKRDAFDFDKSPKSYLFTAVYNRCLNYLRDQKSFQSTISEEVENVTELNSDHLQEAELEAQIWKVINELPEKCREVFILNRFEGKKYAEVAEMLNISIKTVETQMSKALKTLRESLKEYIHLLLFFIIKSLW